MTNKDLFDKIFDNDEIYNAKDIVYYSAGYPPVAGTNTAGYPPTVLGGGPPVEAKVQITGDGKLKTQSRGGKFYINIEPT